MENGAVCLLKVHRRHGHCHDRTARTVKEAEQNLALRILLAQAALHPFNDREMWADYPSCASMWCTTIASMYP